MRSRLIATMAVVALALTGCGSSDAAAPPAKGSDHNEADVQFSMQMIPHHKQTIQIADMATKRGGAEPVKVVAAEILSAEERDIKAMSGWLRSWDVPVPSGEEHKGMDMPNMLSEKDIKALEAASGPEFDKLFLTTVAKHLQGGVEMSKDVLKSGKHAETKALAGKIVTEQEDQIKKVQALIT